MYTHVSVISIFCIILIFIQMNVYSTPVSSPIGLKVEYMKATSMVISWQPPHDVTDIRGYQVSYTPLDGSELLHDVSGDATRTELIGLNPHTEYTICVRAKGVDYGNYSAQITACTLENSE